MIEKIQLRKLYHRYEHDRRTRLTQEAADAYYKAEREAFRTLPIVRVDLMGEEMWYYIRVILQGDIEVKCRYPRFGWMYPGGFLLHSDVIGKTVDETWVKYAAPSIKLGICWNHEVFDVWEWIEASRDAQGIVLPDVPREDIPDSMNKLRERYKCVLEYIHPDAPYALTNPELPPTTWNPPIRIEWREEPDWSFLTDSLV